MKNIQLLIIVVGSLLLLLLFFVSLSAYRLLTGNGALENQLKAQLENVAFSKASRVSSFLDEKKDDLAFLSSSPDIITAFKKTTPLSGVDELNTDMSSSFGGRPATGGTGDHASRGVEDVIDVFSEDASLGPEVEEFLKFFQKANEYYDLILISIDGQIIWTAQQKELIGKNLTTSEFADTKLGEVYHKVKKDFGIGIFDPGYFGREQRLSVFVTTPVLVGSQTVGKKDIIGIIALQIDNQQVESKVNVHESLGPGAQIYLVNRDGTPITTLINRSGKQITNIDTQMKKDCFADYDNFYIEKQGKEIKEVLKSGQYKNALGQTVFGAHQYILQTGWCALIEVGEKDFYQSVNKRVKED